MSLTMSGGPLADGPPLVTSMLEFQAGHKIAAVVFGANGEHLYTVSRESLRVWRVRDGNQIAAMKTGELYSVAVSKDSRWIAAGTFTGNVLLWDANTFEHVFAFRNTESYPGLIAGVDFSPDSTQLVDASWSGKATIWDVPTRKRVFALEHDGKVTSARYSPEGERVATATLTSVRVWDSYDGRLLMHVEVEVTGVYNTGLLWHDYYHLFVISGNKIKKIEAFTRLIVSEWPVPNSSHDGSGIALPQCGKFIAHSSKFTTTIWDTSTHAKLCVVPQNPQTRSITLSPDDQLLATASSDGKIVITRLPQNLSGVDSDASDSRNSTLHEPEIQIDDNVLRSWKDGQLTRAEVLLTAAITGSDGPRRHLFACRALVRTHLGQWDAAIVDAEESIKVQQSAIGYVAKCVALVGKGETREGFRVCDIAFQHFRSSHVAILLLVKAVVLFIAGEHDDAMARMDDLIAAVEFNSALYVVQAYMYLLHGNSQMNSGDYERAIRTFQRALVQLLDITIAPPLVISLVSGWKFDDLGITIRQRLCEAFCGAGRVVEAAGTILEIINTCRAGDKPIPQWVIDITQRCLSTTEGGGNASQVAEPNGDVTMPPQIRRLQSAMPLLREWIKLRLTSSSWEDTLAVSADFVFPRFSIVQVVCECLEAMDRTMDAVSCFRQFNNDSGEEMDDEQAYWVSEFVSRYLGRFEELGNAAMNAGQYSEAISHYTVGLSLNPDDPQSLLVQRSRAYVGSGLWEDALNDANELIRLDPSSPLGYERKNAALHGAGSYSDAVDALETMLLKMSQSHDPDVRDRSLLYVQPEKTREMIGAVIEKVARELPPALINTESGRLHDKSGIATWFKSQPIFHELISSMITDIDHGRIKHEVTQYYRYASFSDAMEDNEELFARIMNTAVYDLEESPAHDKLQMYCKTVRDAGINWAWSDAWCINRKEHAILQEALLSMFKWYESSSLTVVFLLGVPRHCERGALTRSIWNAYPWALQVYLASKVIRFYTEDWTPYMDVAIYNHKESPQILSEVELATGVSARMLTSLRPGLVDIREKLRLASTRQATRVEDTAYSLFGLFSLSVPVVYGEGDKALGRLLSELFIRSGETSILAWTGRSGGFNSCFPSNNSVFNHPQTLYIPPGATPAETKSAAAGLRTSPVNINLAAELYDRLDGLAVPTVAGQRMKLPCLSFRLEPVLVSRHGPGHIFRAQAVALGEVEIKTHEDISQFGALHLVHPWIDFLLDRRPIGSRMEVGVQEHANIVPSSVLGDPPPFDAPSRSTSTTPQTRSARLVAHLGRPFSGRHVAPAPETPSPRSPPTEKQEQALGLIARLRKPFGALLLAPAHSHGEAYRRVASDSLITVQVEGITPTIMDNLIQNVRVLDVL